LDEQLQGRADAQGRLVVPNVHRGEHRLKVSLPGYPDFAQTLSVLPKQIVNVRAPLEIPAGASSVNPRDGQKYAWIPPGTFLMGCSPNDAKCDEDEKPSHRVTITKGFWLGQTEVTVGMYKRFASAAGRALSPAPNFNANWGYEQMPMVNVTWEDARAYCRWAGGRLPTEAEWEYAARAGSTQALYGPLEEIAWYDKNSGRAPRVPASKRPNAFNLYDVLGNVWEWVSDWYDKKYYENSPPRDPRGATNGEERALRGGSWGGGPGDVRVSNRNRVKPDYRNEYIGFRCLREGGP
jgi:formylglycine-generating enzyme required for sulfatase activity